MKRTWNILLFAFFTFCLFLFKPRQDVVFTAINETQYIRLFEEGQDFEICLEEDKFFTGTYMLSEDTVFLMYREHPDYAALKPATSPPAHLGSLPRKLFITRDRSEIRSMDEHTFSAMIHQDLRQVPGTGQQIHILAARPE